MPLVATRINLGRLLAFLAASSHDQADTLVRERGLEVAAYVSALAFMAEQAVARAEFETSRDLNAGRHAGTYAVPERELLVSQYSFRA